MITQSHQQTIHGWTVPDTFPISVSTVGVDIVVSWTYVPGLVYDVYVGTTGIEYTVAASGIASGSYTLAGQSQNTTYYIYVVASRDMSMNHAWYSFDGNVNNHCDTGYGVSGIQFDFGAATPKIISRIDIKQQNQSNDSGEYNAIVFEGSNDDSSWETLGTVEIANLTVYTVTLSVANTTAYRYYRFTKECNGDGWYIYEIDLWELIVPSA